MNSKSETHNNKDVFGEIETKKDFNGFRIINNSFCNVKSTLKHFHSDDYLCYIINGSFRASSENKCETFEMGEFFIQPAGMKHNNNFLSQTADCINFSFNDKYLKLYNIELLFDSFRKIQSYQMNKIMGKIIKENISSDDFSAIIVESLLIDLLGSLGKEIIVSRYENPKWFKAIIEYLHDDYANKYKLEDLAQVANIHPSYLVNAFKNITNTTIGEYLRIIRIRRVCSLLTSELSIAQIAYDCGFADQSHLSRSFKKVTGLTPLTYRNRILSN